MYFILQMKIVYYFHSEVPAAPAPVGIIDLARAKWFTAQEIVGRPGSALGVSRKL